MSLISSSGIDVHLLSLPVQKHEPAEQMLGALQQPLPQRFAPFLHRFLRFFFASAWWEAASKPALPSSDAPRRERRVERSASASRQPACVVRAIAVIASNAWFRRLLHDGNVLQRDAMQLDLAQRRATCGMVTRATPNWLPCYPLRRTLRA